MMGDRPNYAHWITLGSVIHMQPNRFIGSDLYSSLLNKHYLSLKFILCFISHREKSSTFATYTLEIIVYRHFDSNWPQNTAHVAHGFYSHLSEVVWLIFSLQSRKKKKKKLCWLFSFRTAHWWHSVHAPSQVSIQWCFIYVCMCML